MESSNPSYKDTLNLPRTDFPIRSNPRVEDPAMIERWHQEKLYEKSMTCNAGNTRFILHDGPPYANGHPHLGSAYNKILKDIVSKARRMFGEHVPVVPGWDCHGLPIEHKVTQENPGLSRLELMRKCRAFAQHWVEVQKEAFRNLGIVMDWDHPYLTMSPDYEATIMRSFAQFVASEYVERKNKTVPWCPHCQTVLASAEIEYAERKDPSIYVLFPLEAQSQKRLFGSLVAGPVSLLVWTTTPWTLPLNRAVLLHPDTTYVVMLINDRLVMMGKDSASLLCAQLDLQPQVILEISSKNGALKDALVQHPFIEDLQVPIILDQSVELGEGTACVHCAPGAGPIDYEIGVRNKLDIYSPVAPDGSYTNDVQPAELAGMPIADGQGWVIKKLLERGNLLHKGSIRHSYPHCWRCRNGLIFRATKQWFLDLTKNNLQQKTSAVIDTLKMTPEKSKNRLRSMLEGRLEWCLSRQRVWGVPIVALLCVQCDEAYTSPELIERVANEVEKKGIEQWELFELKDLVPVGMTCRACGGSTFKKEQDILDVWFDSGLSHCAVLERHEALSLPADLYLEGKDQHRGWFQSSLLTSIALHNQTCTKAIMTHGFVVDKDNRKMSKSVGNVVTPEQMVEKLGTDGLRLWVSSIDIAGEAVVSDILIRNVQEINRKVRNTARFLLSNLYDFDIERDAVPFEKLTFIDDYALRELLVVNYEILQAYAQADLTAVFHKLGDWVTSLSSLYLDIIKDRLYCDAATSYERRSAQTVCYLLLDSMTRLMAPIMSFTAEQIADQYQGKNHVSIHLQAFARLDNVWRYYAQCEKDMPHQPSGNEIVTFAIEHFEELLCSGYRKTLMRIRGALLKVIEQQREQSNIKHSLEARVAFFVEVLGDHVAQLHQDLEKTTQTPAEFWREFLIVSQVVLQDNTEELAQTDLPGLWATVTHAKGTKCPRCWQWHENGDARGLCKRCAKAI